MMCTKRPRDIPEPQGYRAGRRVSPFAQIGARAHPVGSRCDGTEFVAGPRNATSLPSGHGAWVVGEPVVVVDWFGAGNYAKAH